MDSSMSSVGLSIVSTLSSSVKESLAPRLTPAFNCEFALAKLNEANVRHWAKFLTLQTN
jgi:hypothetical protein